MHKTKRRSADVLAPQSLSQNLNREVSDFCDREAITNELEAAINLIRTHFHIVSGPVIQLESDPELVDSSYLVLDFVTRGTPREVMESHKKFARDWLTAAPWPKSEKIRIIYDIN